MTMRSIVLATTITVSALAQSPINVPTPTLGGKQFWGDVYLFGGWRIQRNVFTQHCRLLDANDVRRAWGTQEHCEATLANARTEGRAKLHSKKLCLLIHGYLRAKDSFASMQRALEAAGFEVYAVNYPSAQYRLEALSDDTAALLTRVSADFDQVNIVTHSMGGIIARRITSESPLKGGGRLVMLAPPNQGARMADLLLSWWPSQYVTGPAGKQLVTQASALVHSAGNPQSPFAIITGGRGDASGYNPAIPGDDDGVVAVEETRLDGAAEQHVVPALHTFIMNNDEAITLTKDFLMRGTP